MRTAAAGGVPDLSARLGRFVAMAMLRREFHISREEANALTPRAVRWYLAILAGMADSKRAENERLKALGKGG